MQKKSYIRLENERSGVPTNGDDLRIIRKLLSGCMGAGVRRFLEGFVNRYYNTPVNNRVIGRVLGSDGTCNETL